MRFTNLVVGWFKKFSLPFFNVMKLLSVPHQVFFDDLSLWYLLQTLFGICYLLLKMWFFFTNFIRSPLIGTKSFGCSGHLVPFKSNVNPVLCTLDSIRFLPFRKNMAFHLSLQVLFNLVASCIILFIKK